MEEIKNPVNDIEPKEDKLDSDELNIQKFMEDMIMLGQQIKNPDLQKPNFHYGDLSVTNYLLWLMLGELMKLNDEIKEDG